MNTPVVQAKQLTFIRNGEEIIRDFSFEIRKGDYVGVIGPNGGGKTTLLRLILGLLKPTGGTIELFGRPQTDASVRHRIGYVAQRGGNLDAQFPATVLEVIRSGRTPRIRLGKFKKHDEDIVQRVISDLQIESLMYRTMGVLSGGERQKVLLARALVMEPEILCLDEPVDGLDPASRVAFYELLAKINQSGVTIIFVSHDVHAVVANASSAICLKHELVCHGNSACHIHADHLRDLFHKDRADLLIHHAS